MPIDQREDATGYLHETYARSLSGFGRPRYLPASRGWILERSIPGSDEHDAMGCYPLFTCGDWTRLCTDIQEACSGLVSLTFVTDPFAAIDVRQLRRCLDKVRPFKDHLIADLTQPASERISRHHRYYARTAQKRGIEVERCDRPPELLDEWVRLYDVLIERHRLTGLKRFSREAFEQQLAVPGAVVFRALYGGETVAAQIWYVQGGFAHSHLQATDAIGYERRAAYALYGQALDWLAGRCSYAALGAAAGSGDARNDGLWHFKRGWATEMKRTYLCMHTFDAAVYQELADARAPGGTGYFPAYRAGELI